MRRHYLDPVGDKPVADVVRRLCGVQSQVASYAELCIRFRREASKPGEVARALSEGRLIKTWAMRGTLHLLAPEDAGQFLSLLAAGRSWESPAWQKYFGVTAKQLDALREVVRETLDGKALTRAELIAALTARRGYGHLGDALRSGWGTLLKPYAWQGDLCFGPSQGNRVTFTTPRSASSRWAELPDPDEAAPAAISAYLRAYGPATADSFIYWIGSGRVGKQRVRAWFEALGSRLAEVEIGGERAYVLARTSMSSEASRRGSVFCRASSFRLGRHPMVTFACATASPVSNRAGSRPLSREGCVRGPGAFRRPSFRSRGFKEAGAARRSALRPRSSASPRSSGASCGSNWKAPRTSRRERPEGCGPSCR